VPLVGDILLTSVGTLGVSYQVQESDYFYFKDGNLTWFKDFSDEIHTKFLLYWLRSLPDLPTQTAIAEILSSLDDKIELNNKINQELENLAQTLFKQWFIDFEFPYDFAQGKPNENGAPYRSSGGEMVDSELGMIPKGWGRPAEFINKDFASWYYYYHSPRHCWKVGFCCYPNGNEPILLWYIRS
jgi:type I restriction enzyme, S subunit